MPVEKIAESLMKAVMHNIKGIDAGQAAALIRRLRGSKRIFVVGAGRSGYVAKSFAMRLMHLGFEVFVTGETITPAIRRGDVLVAVSGSGETSSTVLIAKTAKRQKARVLSITSHANSALGKLSDIAVIIKGRLTRERELDYFARQLVGGHESLAPLGTLFELTTMFFLDCIISELMIVQKTGERYLKMQHTNLE